MKGSGGDETPVLKDLVLIGGGHSHVHVLKMWGMQPLPGVQLTLIARDVSTPYSGMLPGHIAGHYTKDECHIDLCKLARFAGARLIHSAACGLDLAGRRVVCEDGRPPVAYDVLSVDIGSAPRTVHTKTHHTKLVTAVKPIDGFSARWQEVLHRAARWRDRGGREGAVEGEQGASSSERPGGGRAPLRLVVVGGGAGGVELALAMQHRLTKAPHAPLTTDTLQVELVSRGESVLLTHNSGVQRIFKRLLAERGVTLHLQADVVGVEEEEGGGWLLVRDGRRLPFHECMWCTDGAPQTWVRESGLCVDGQGFISVDDHLMSTSHPGVFAAGDICSMVRHPRPKAGVFAVRQGPPLLDNLKRFLTGRPLQPFTPQSTFLGLISTGDQYAVASKGGWLALEGAWLWWLKDRIDRKFMRMYQELPVMSVRPVLRPPAVAAASGPEALALLTQAPMRCGGCGSKVGASILSRVLSQLRPLMPPASSRPDVLAGLDSPDDAAVVAVPSEGGQGQGQGGLVTVHTVDFFRSFLPDPYVFGMVAANHALSDCHAMNAQASTALALAVVPYAAEDKMESVLLQAMAGAVRVLSESGCVLVGGHTSEGSELSLGFCINGTASDRGQLLLKGGLRPGQALVLTKPLGVGTLFAAEMRGQAKATWLQAAIASMLRSNRQAARVLREVGGAVSCTDVTGFGLLGHLLEMLKASSSPSSPAPDGDQHQGAEAVSCVLDLDRLPLLPGAQECVQAGITSSLQPHNLRLRRALDRQACSPGALEHARFPLLFDPQTAGGLLAAVPADRVQATLQALREQGGAAEAVVVGHVTQASPLQQQLGQLVVLTCTNSGQDSPPAAAALGE